MTVCEPIIEEVVAENYWQIVSLAIQPDHVHLFLRASPYTLPIDIARKIKGRSSHLLREAYPFLKKMPSASDPLHVLQHSGERLQ